jgi:hypothetical protein
VVTFITDSPDTLLVGTESKGLFRSTDVGSTWENIVPEGQRFTVVRENRHLLSDGGPRYVAAATCPDAFIPLLGEGNATVATKAESAALYVSSNGGETMDRVFAGREFGFLNLNTPNINAFTYIAGTTHGLVMMSDRGMYAYIFSNVPGLDSLRPVIGIGTTYRPPSAFVTPTLQAVNPEDPRVFSRGVYFNGENWLTPTLPGAAPHKGTLKLVPQEFGTQATEDRVWIVGLNGLYRTEDSFKTLRPVLLSENGTLLPANETMDL